MHTSGGVWVSTWRGACCHPRLPPNVGVQPGLMSFAQCTHASVANAAQVVWSVHGGSCAQTCFRDQDLASGVAQGSGKAAYLQDLDHQRGTGPPQQRARVLLNLFASMRQHHPLSDTLLLVDT